MWVYVFSAKKIKFYKGGKKFIGRAGIRTLDLRPEHSANPLYHQNFMGNVFWGRQYHCEVCFDIDSMGAQLFAGFGPPCGVNKFLPIGKIF